MTHETEPDGEAEERGNEPRIPFTRRDVMKAAGTGAVAGLAATGTASAADCACESGTTECVSQSEGCSYCKIDNPSGSCTVPGTSITIERTSGDCIAVSDPEGEASQIALKSGSQCTCTNFTGDLDGDSLCTSCGQDISHVTVEYNCDVEEPPEECDYEEVTTRFGSEVCCDAVDVCVSGVEDGCPVEARLDLSAEGSASCGSPTLTYSADGPECQTFDLSGEDCCCVPDSVSFFDKDGNEIPDTSLDISGLECVCTETVSQKFEGAPSENDTFTVGGVTVTVTGTSEGCFTWEADGPVVAIGVKGGPGDPNPNNYGNCTEGQMLPSCGATSGEACAPFNPNSGKRYGVSNFTIYVCAHDFGGCL